MLRLIPRSAPARALSVATAAIAVGLLAGCGGSSTSSNASGAAHSALANPAVSTDVARLETKLLASWQKHFDPMHPVKSSEAAIMETFPHGNTAATASYAVKQLNTSMIGSSQDAKTARDAWAQKVVLYGLGPAGSPTAVPSPGSANIPGYPGYSASPSVSP